MDHYFVNEETEAQNTQDQNEIARHGATKCVSRSSALKHSFPHYTLLVNKAPKGECRRRVKHGEVSFCSSEGTASEGERVSQAH